jgi:hypothetical protein
MFRRKQPIWWSDIESLIFIYDISIARVEWQIHMRLIFLNKDNVDFKPTDFFYRRWHYPSLRLPLKIKDNYCHVIIIIIIIIAMRLCGDTFDIVCTHFLYKYEAFILQAISPLLKSYGSNHEIISGCFEYYNSLC